MYNPHPRVVARADHLQRHPHFLHALLAPFFCVGYFHATRRRMAASWLLTTAIVILIVVVGRLPQPWRGLVDVGVVLGLAVGLGSLAYFVIRWIGQGDLGVDPELPSASEKKRK